MLALARRPALTLVALLLPAVLFVGPAGADVPEPAFCAERVALDYGKAFEQMPPQHPPPHGELPFGPRNLAIYRIELGGEAVLPKNRLGYLFAAKDEGRRSLRLDWAIASVLWRVGRDGHKLRRLEVVHRRIGKTKDLDELKLVFPPRDPGFYRIETRFRTLSGRRLGAYSEYVRVVRPKLRTTLVAGPEVVVPGGTAFAQVRNAGTLGAIVPFRVPVERWTGSEWVEVEPAGVPDITEQDSWWVGLGEAAPCSRFQLAPDAPPGRYRFAATGLVEVTREKFPLRASFTVSGAPLPAP